MSRAKIRSLNPETSSLNPNNLHDSFCVLYCTNRGLEGQLPFVMHTSLLLLHEQIVYTA